MGRSSGSRNRGYFFRKDRGWFTKIDGRFVPLQFENSDRMRDQNTPLAAVKAAYLRTIEADDEPESDALAIFAPCAEYLNYVKDEGAQKTYDSRSATLFDFCFVLPPQFRTNKEKPIKSDYIHKGCRKLPADRLTKLNVNHWLQAHPT